MIILRVVQRYLLESRLECRLAAATGHPDKLRWEFLLLLTCPLPLQPGVGHFKIVSCIARTVNKKTNRGLYHIRLESTHKIDIIG